MITFAYPRLLWLLVVLLPLVAWYVYNQIRGGAALNISSTESIPHSTRSVKYYLRHLPYVARLAAIVLIIIALARPQTIEKGSNATTEGIDIVLAMDLSTSMYAADLKPSRIDAARAVASKFIVDRTNDRMGIVLFAGESFSPIPLTMDKGSLLNIMGKFNTYEKQVLNGTIDDGTAIGNGLATAINRLKDSDAASKVIILLTDGVNNRGQIAPLTAAEIATTLGIKVYTIGVGTMGTAPYPVIDQWGEVYYQNIPVEIDEETLRQIATMTQGEYFRATDEHKLSEIYDRINKLERTEIEITEFTLYNELYGKYLLWAIVLLIAEFLMRRLWFKQLS